MVQDNAEQVEKLCFVVGPIGQKQSETRKHADLLLHAVIRHVLEAEPFGYAVRRADEDAHPGMIGDRVIQDIVHARLVVADLTELNPNAFYELGIRHSTRLPAIHIARSGTPLPFDNLGHRTIFVDLSDWDSIEDARRRLSNSAGEIEKTGYVVSNPVTQADVSFALRTSRDPKDRALAAVQSRLDALEASFARRQAQEMQQLSKQQRIDLFNADLDTLDAAQSTDQMRKAIYRLAKKWRIEVSDVAFDVDSAYISTEYGGIVVDLPTLA